MEVVKKSSIIIVPPDLSKCSGSFQFVSVSTPKNTKSPLNSAGPAPFKLTPNSAPVNGLSTSPKFGTAKNIRAPDSPPHHSPICIFHELDSVL